MVDESPDGFRLRFIKGEKKTLGAGDIVALQPRESSKIHVCFVRRISSSQVRLEIGLQLMSPQVSVVDVTIEDVTDESRGIFLHSLPAYGKFAGLIIPPGTYRSGQKVLVKLPGRSLLRQLGTCMEANDGLAFFTSNSYPTKGCSGLASGLHCRLPARMTTLHNPRLTRRRRDAGHKPTETGFPSRCSATATPFTPAITPTY